MDEVLNKVLTLVHQFAGPRNIGFPGPDDDLSSAGLGSLEIVGLMVEIESVMDIEFPSDEINANTFRSARTIAEAVCRIGASQ
jgi:acyl carrier protein